MYGPGSGGGGGFGGRGGGGFGGRVRIVQMFVYISIYIHNILLCYNSVYVQYSFYYFNIYCYFIY